MDAESEWDRLRRELRQAGVAGVEDLGRFTSGAGPLALSGFDEKAAMPVLLEALPTLDDPNVVSAVAGHLRRPWARPRAFEPLLATFLRWSVRNPLPLWHVGDALGTATTKPTAPRLVELCLDPAHGTARQMPVMALGRFGRVPGVEPALLQLVHDPDVGLHAMSALRRVLGAAGATPYVETVARDHAGTSLGEQAERELKKLRKATQR